MYQRRRCGLKIIHLVRYGQQYLNLCKSFVENLPDDVDFEDDLEDLGDPEGEKDDGKPK